MTSYRGKRVTVMGLGTRAGGLGVARYFVEQGALVTVTDGKSADELAGPIAELHGLPVEFALGGHQDRHFTPEGADLVVRNPAVRRWSPYLALARESGVPIEMEMSIFLQASPVPVIGITGTKGKTSTAAIAGSILTAWRPNTVLAGNMGVSAVAYLSKVEADTPVVLEISNWQLEGMDERSVGPKIAVLTNIHEDHLDTYDGFDDYANTKRSIARHLSSTDTLIVNRDNAEAFRAAAQTRARVASFGAARPSGDGFWLEDRFVCWETAGSAGRVELPDRFVYQGVHQRLNASAAIAAALVRGADLNAVREGLERFDGVKDRTELVAQIDGVLFVNDTSATAPAAAIAALDAYPGRNLHVIAGGFDKQLELAPLGQSLAEKATTIILLDGSATPRLMETIRNADGRWLGPFDSMQEAVEAGAAQASAGDVVILSPGCASFGLFRDEFDRGEKFREAVAKLKDTSGS
ncbi:MAG TPA: UDP-N-acetylmuramoyl-L-alanine--D-glutamate ligase [Thermomicrobiales bacterium]|nr:UDP-N-acetylmuramoyl-L-alanine--D-glutamate ligase [Thermomicrobiales bacterium]